ncbi:hypothetical protein Tco_1522956, partial [Tanacetum coccineum]
TCIDAEERCPTIKKLEVNPVEFKLEEDCWEIQVRRSKYCLLKDEKVKVLPLGNMISMKNEGTAKVNKGTAEVNESTAEKIKVPLLFVKVPLVLSDILELEFHRCVFLSYLLAGGNLFLLKWCDEDLSKSSKVSHIEDKDFVKRIDHYMEPTEFEIQKMTSLSFHDAEDAKTLWSAIKARFGGNEASKKMQKNLLKQQFETFTIGSREELDSAYEKLPTMIRDKLDCTLKQSTVDPENISKGYTRLPYQDNVAKLLLNVLPTQMYHSLFFAQQASLAITLMMTDPAAIAEGCYGRT